MRRYDRLFLFKVSQIQNSDQRRVKNVSQEWPAMKSPDETGKQFGLRSDSSNVRKLKLLVTTQIIGLALFSPCSRDNLFDFRQSEFSIYNTQFSSSHFFCYLLQWTGPMKLQSFKVGIAVINGTKPKHGEHMPFQDYPLPHRSWHHLEKRFAVPKFLVKLSCFCKT